MSRPPIPAAAPGKGTRPRAAGLEAQRPGARANRSPGLLVVAWILLALTLLLLLVLWGQRAFMGPEAMVASEAAAALYRAGDPATAQLAYAQLVQQGAGGADLYHNLGAAALRAGDLNAAVEALETAQQMAPREVEIAAALETARAAQANVGLTTVALPMARDRTLLSRELLLPGMERLTGDETALGAAVLWVGLAALLLAAIAPGRRRSGEGLRALPLLAALPAGLLLALFLLAMQR